VRTIWLNCRKWRADVLDGKLVQFRITYADGEAEGIGSFIVRGNGVERMGIDIMVIHPQQHFDTYYHLTNTLAEAIEVHPDPSVAQFRCVGLFDPSS